MDKETIKEVNKRAEDLNTIMQKYGTDKGIPGNNYYKYYDSLFGEKRNSVTKVLEIGIFNGASLLTWQDWFPLAQIIGIDINKDCLKNYGPRIITEYCDQSNASSLHSIGNKHTNIDIIIDDGSHVCSMQTLSFDILFNSVVPGGWYVVEDAFLTDKWNGEAGKIFYHMNKYAEMLNRYKIHIRENIVNSIHSITHFDSLIAIQKKWY